MSTAENYVPYMPHGEATPESVQLTIDGALELLGPNGEHWIQGQLTRFEGVGQPFAYCVVGALEHAAPDYESYAAARDALKETLGSGNIDRFNNRSGWSQVQTALEQTASRIAA